MKNRVEGLVRQYRTARKRRLRFEAMVTALSVLVTGGVFWQLRRYGTAISDVPAAELPENGIPVVETDADPPDGTAGSGMAEEPEDWEAALPAFTNESAQQRIAAIAVSQLGYAEGSGGALKLVSVLTKLVGSQGSGSTQQSPLDAVMKMVGGIMGKDQK